MATVTSPSTRRIESIEPVHIVNKTNGAALLSVLDDSIAKRLGIENIDELRAEAAEAGADAFKVVYNDRSWETYLLDVSKAAPKPEPYGAEWQAQQIAWLDEHAKQYGIEAARKLADVNKATAWGRAWLAKHADAVQKSGAETARKTAEVTLEKAATDLETYVAKRASELKLTKWATVGMLTEKRDETFAQLSESYSKAQHAAASSLGGGQLEAIDAEIAKLAGEEDADVEKFAVAHNLGPAHARERLLGISKTAAERHEQIRDLYTTRTRAMAEVEHARIGVESAKRADQADALSKAVEVALASAHGPAGRKFVERCAAVAKARSLTLPAAIEHAMKHDPVAQALAEVDAQEKGR